MSKKNIVILGSSGSIGENALDVVRQFKDKFRVIGLCVNANTRKLVSQIKEFKPEFAAVGDASQADSLGSFCGNTKILKGAEGVCRLASLKEADVVLVAIVGSSAIFPLLSAIRASKKIALANKEAVVVAGDLILPEAKKRKVEIIPIDSEQNAIFQCLQGQGRASVENVYLTASGGPLVDCTAKELERVTLAKVLAHPRWKMGKKITVDSATLMNKGLEVLEAKQLFGLALEQVKVLVHRQAVVHSLVEFRDGSMLAQLAATDMRLPIQYALTYPERLHNSRLRIDLSKTGPLSFSNPDVRRFPCLELAYEAGRIGAGAPCALNAANEVAVASFLEGKLPFVCIPRIIEKVMKAREFPVKDISLKAIFDTDKAARKRARDLTAFFRKRGH